ncbi:MAG: hypothetical protein AB2L20_25430 [Mangrovibacterium sp.]
MNETDRAELSDEVRRLAMDLLSNETLVVKQAAEDDEQEVLFYGRAGIGGDTITLLNNASPVIADLCRCLLSASAANRQASWNFILKALS